MQFANKLDSKTQVFEIKIVFRSYNDNDENPASNMLFDL